jgi:hypothetical protein
MSTIQLSMFGWRVSKTESEVRYVGEQLRSCWRGSDAQRKLTQRSHQFMMNLNEVYS